MASSIEEALDKIANAKPSDGGNWVGPGRHVFEVQKIGFKKGFKGLSFIANLIVIESEGGETHDGKPVKAHRVGETRDEVQNLDGKAAEMAPANIKSFVCGLLGLDPNAVSDAEVKAILGGQDVVEDGKQVHVPGLIEGAQPAKGMRIACTATERLSKNGKAYTNKKWITISQTDEEIAVRRKAQEGQKAA